MQILTLSKENGKIILPKTSCNYSIALGRFDGVHSAHRALIELAKAHACPKSAVFIFSDEADNRLTTLSEKLSIFEEMGVDCVFLAEFDDVKNLCDEEFVNDVLFSIGCRYANCGFNYRFGKGAKGNSERLCELCEKYGIGFSSLDALYDGDSVISSSLIRRLIESGEVERANKLLLRPFSLSGTVTVGYRQGRNIGFPTLNIIYPEKSVRLKEGVYASVTYIGSKDYKSVTNIGHNPTLPKECLMTETYLIGADGDYYGEKACIDFLGYLRGELKLSGLDELKAVIQNDIRSAEEYHLDYPIIHRQEK